MPSRHDRLDFLEIRALPDIDVLVFGHPMGSTGLDYGVISVKKLRLG